MAIPENGLYGYSVEEECIRYVPTYNGLTWMTHTLIIVILFMLF